MSAPILWLSLTGGALVLYLLVARTVRVKSRRDIDEGPSPGDIDAGRYLASGHVAWKGSTIFRRRRRTRQGRNGRGSTGKGTGPFPL